MTTAPKNILAAALASATILSASTLNAQATHLDSLRSEGIAYTWHYALPIEIHDAIARNSPRDLRPWFHTSVEIITPNVSGVFSSRQAGVVVDDFFATLAITGYDIECERSIGEQTLTIGVINANSMRLRVYILTNNQNNSKRIQQIKIEEQK